MNFMRTVYSEFVHVLNKNTFLKLPVFNMNFKNQLLKIILEMHSILTYPREVEGAGSISSDLFF